MAPPATHDLTALENNNLLFTRENERNESAEAGNERKTFSFEMWTRSNAIEICRKPPACSPHMLSEYSITIEA